MPDFRLVAPIRTVSEMNSREHWGAVSARKNRQKKTMWALLADKRPPKPPMDIFLTRIAPRRMDCDNNVSGMKWIRDAISEWLGIDDGDRRLVWHYDQRKGEPKEYAVVIEVLTGREEAA